MKKILEKSWVIIRGLWITLKTMWKRKSLMPLSMLWEEQVVNDGKGFTNYGTVFDYVRVEMKRKI